MDISNISNAINSLAPCIGFDKLLSQSNKDQGDTSQRVGALFTLLSVLESEILEKRITEQHATYDAAMVRLQTEPGVWHRSNDPAYWGYNPRFMSRDQLSVIKIAICMRGDSMRMWDTFKRAAGRFFFHQNYKVDGPQNQELGYKFPDIMAPSEWGVFARALMGPLSFLVTYVTDLAFFVDLVVRKNHPWDYDNMLALNLILAYKKRPTLWSKIAMKKYIAIMPEVLERLANYHLDVDGRAGCPPLYYLFKAALEKIQDDFR